MGSGECGEEYRGGVQVSKERWQQVEGMTAQQSHSHPLHLSLVPGGGGGGGGEVHCTASNNCWGEKAWE